MRKPSLCLLLLLLLQLCMLAAAQKTALDSELNLEIYRHLRNWIFQNFGTRGEGRKLSTWNAGNVQEEVPFNVPFPCNVTGGRSPKVPDSVHQLRPGDIDVIAAMGDSLTVGAGALATNIFQIPIENRGVTASIGGEGTWRTYLTLPNILKEFNPKLIGYSLGDSLISHPASQLNVGEIGAMSRDMPFMAKYLVDRIRNDPRIDFKRHWKLISLFIGNNDFCSELCSVSSPWSILESHKTDLINALRILRDNLPRSFVALYMPPNLKALVAAQEGRYTLNCYLFTMMECSCMFALQFRARRLEYYDIMSRWQDLDAEIADYPEFHRKDFTVVVLPNLQHTTLPLAEDGYTDRSYLSSDCFHLTQKANAQFTNNIWNNLLEPVGNKTKQWTVIYERFLCPTPERPFLMTSENSRKYSKFWKSK